MRLYKRALSVIIAALMSLAIAEPAVNANALTTSKTLRTSHVSVVQGLSAKNAVAKVAASIDNKAPKQNATVKVTVTGPAKGKVKIVCHYKTKNTTYTGTICSNGKVIIPVRISRATKGYKVNIDVTVTSGNKKYTTKTYFIPR